MEFAGRDKNFAMREVRKTSIMIHMKMSHYYTSNIARSDTK